MFLWGEDKVSLDNEIVNADEEIGGITPIEQANPVAPAASALPEATKEVESNKPWSSDQSVSTLGEQTDDVILAHLPEYVGSNILNSTINGALIEEAQSSAEELMEVLTLDEDELADRDDLTSAIAMAAKEKAKSAKASRETSERIQEAVKADREEQRREEFQKHWDIDTHEYGGEQLTGAEIMENINWFAKPENQRKVRDSLRAQGKTDKEIEDAIAKTKERDDLLKKLRETPDGLSPEDKKRLEVLNRDSLVLRTSAIVNAGRKQDKDIDVAADSPKNMSAEENKDETIRMRQSMAAKANETSVLVLSKEKDEQLSSSAKAYEHFSSARPLGKDFKAVSVASNSQENELEVTKPKMQMAYAPKLQADAALM